MYSMTGYGKGTATDSGVSVTVEIKTVNNRNLDVVLKSPRAFMQFDDEVRKTVASAINRGRAEVFVSYTDDREDSADFVLNEKLAAVYVSQAVKLERFFGVENDIKASSLLRMPDVLTENADKDFTCFKSPLFSALSLALSNLIAMRKTEGEKLSIDMLSRLGEVARLREEIVRRAPLVAKEYSEKLKRRIEDALSGVTECDEGKILSEVAFFVDKSNIDEELTRLSSHISQFRKIAEEENAGKKLDFLMQEFNREANTICSKANDITITNLALSLKNEIEKIREQVQNVE